MSYRLSRKAEADLIDLYLASVERFGVDQSELYVAGLEAAFDFIAEFPRAAPERAEVRPPVRIHVYRSHIIVYALKTDGVLILRIRHGSEDWERAPAAQ